jgi:lysyl-tRNA synthetase, class II
MQQPLETTPINISTSSVDYQRQLRIEKINTIKSFNQEPFAVESIRDYKLAELDNLFKTTLPEGESHLVGRIKTIRMSGKIAFYILEDESLPEGFQVILKKDVLPERSNFESFSFEDIKTTLDDGDYVQVKGKLELSLRGQQSMMVNAITILTKALRPLPDELDYTNLEERYTNRVVDYKMNTKDDNGLSVRDVVRLKAKYWNIWREEMEKEGFTSVENPIFEHTPGGAEAKPFTTFYNELDQDMYLRISLELPLKRLIAGGFERVYEIGRIFRNESSSPQHLQEYSQIEWYCAYTDYNWAGNFVKRVYQRIVKEVLGDYTQVDYYGTTINWGEWCTKEEADKNDWELEGGWPKIKYFDAVRYFSNGKIDTEQKTAEELVAMCNDNGIEDVRIEDGMATLLDKLWKKARVNTTNPFFLILPPVELEPLAKRDPSEQHLTQRWQIVAGKAELGKAFSELNDPIDQLSRFSEQQAARDAGNDEAQFQDDDYIKAMELGMPPMSGFGTSERFLSFLLGKHIKECSTFPYIKRIEKALTKKRTMVAHAVILDLPSIPMWSKLNACSHLGAAFAARVGKALIDVENSESKDGFLIPMNIQHAIINYKTEDRAKLINYIMRAEQLGLECSVFTEDMRNSSNDSDVEFEHSKKPIESINILGVCIYGKKSDVELLTFEQEFEKAE